METTPNPTVLKQAIPFALGCLIATPAIADGSPDRNILPLSVYYNNTQIGRLAQSGLMARREPDGNIYLINLGEGALNVNQLFWFTSNNCTGKAYAYYWGDKNSHPYVAQFDGQTLWSSDNNFQWINPGSYSWFWNWGTQKVQSQCYVNNNEGYAALVSNPVKLEDVPQWAPNCVLDTLTMPVTNDPVSIPICKTVLTVK